MESLDHHPRMLRLLKQATYVKEKGEIKPSVMKQFLWVNGSRYELQDIYGIGNTVDGADAKELRCLNHAIPLLCLADKWYVMIHIFFS